MESSHKVSFPGSHGGELVGRLELPRGQRPRAYALFAHCFTCSKETAAASQISRSLAAHGLGVLRFDFTGLGGSDGEFENTNFSSNVEDLLAAARFLREHYEAPALLVGHSLGGAAVLIAAHALPECRAVATIAAPYDPAHVTNLLRSDIADISRAGRAEVTLAGRSFTITRQFLEDLERQRTEARLAQLKRALVLFHSPTDAIVGIDNARQIYDTAKHPKSFVSLSGADHLLTRRSDGDYVAAVLAAWVERYLAPSEAHDELAEQAHGRASVREAGTGRFAQTMVLGHHRMVADEPLEFGGTDTGPSPYELLLGALGSCTAMTVRMYAERKRWPLERVTVHLAHDKRHVDDCESCGERGRKLDHVERELVLEGHELSREQRARLLEIANKCPVHRTLHEEVRVTTREREQDRQVQSGGQKLSEQ